MRLDPINLQSKINRMQELYLQILEDIFENTESDSCALEEYRMIKKEILLSLFHEPIHHMDGKYFPDVRRALQKLTLDGDPFLPTLDDKKYEKFKSVHHSISVALDIDLSNEIEQLASDDFYSWFSGEDYVWNKIRGQLLILQSERLPEFLSEFVDEIRNCFIFQQYIAAFILCRTVFEIAIRDIAQKRRLLKEGAKDWIYVKNYVLEQLEEKNRSLEKYTPTLEAYIDLLSLVPTFEGFKKQMHDLRIEGNRVIHANKIVKRSECQKMIKDTFWLIHELYEIN